MDFAKIEEQKIIKIDDKDTIIIQTRPIVTIEGSQGFPGPAGADGIPTTVSDTSTINLTLNIDDLSANYIGSLNDQSDVFLTAPAQGDILYHNGTNWVNLIAGTNGYYLKTQGTGANPVWAAIPTSENPLTFSTGLTRSVDTITANLSTGIAGGQSVIGGTAAGDDLTLSSTTNGTKGNIILTDDTIIMSGKKLIFNGV